jgi:hypothetical protein
VQPRSHQETGAHALTETWLTPASPGARLSALCTGTSLYVQVGHARHCTRIPPHAGLPHSACDPVPASCTAPHTRMPRHGSSFLPGHGASKISSSRARRGRKGCLPLQARGARTCRFRVCCRTQHTRLLRLTRSSRSPRLPQLWPTAPSVCALSVDCLENIMCWRNYVSIAQPNGSNLPTSYGHGKIFQVLSRIKMCMKIEIKRPAPQRRVPLDSFTFDQTQMC